MSSICASVQVLSSSGDGGVVEIRFLRRRECSAWRARRCLGSVETKGISFGYCTASHVSKSTLTAGLSPNWCQLLCLHSYVFSVGFMMGGCDEVR